MKNTHKAGTEPKMSRARYGELKKMLGDRRREIQAEVQGKMRGVREEGTWGGKMNEVLDAVESAEADIQEDIEFALVQMKSETLNKINDALLRLEQGDYGVLFRLRRGNRRKASARAPVRRALQGLRRDPRECRTASTADGRPARHVVAVPRRLTTPATHSGLRRVAEPDPPSPATPFRIADCGLRIADWILNSRSWSADFKSAIRNPQSALQRSPMADQLENLQPEDVSNRRSAAVDSGGAADPPTRDASSFRIRSCRWLSRATDREPLQRLVADAD